MSMPQRYWKVYLPPNRSRVPSIPGQLSWTSTFRSWAGGQAEADGVEEVDVEDVGDGAPDDGVDDDGVDDVDCSALDSLD